MKAFITLSCLVTLALADGPHGHVHAHPAPYHPAPYAPAPYAPAPVYGHAPAYHEPQYNTPPVYEFGYGVQADGYHGGASFGHNEARNGYSTNGEYRVELPDGRTQIVTYSVGDANTGYVADVRYEGTVQPYHPAPAYAPAPVYAPAPAYAPAPVYGRVPHHG